MSKVIEITRSYTRKVNLGNYESKDYFCSRKAEVTEDDDLADVSADLLNDCKRDVLADIQVDVYSDRPKKKQTPN